MINGLIRLNFKVIGFVDWDALNGVGGTHQVLSGGVQFFYIGAVVAAAKVAVTADFNGMDAFFRRYGQDTVGFASTAEYAFCRVDLPEMVCIA